MASYQETKFEELLKSLLEQVEYAGEGEIEWDGPKPGRIDTFESAMVLTHDAGLVVRFEGGAEFQLTIVQSKQGDGFGDDEYMPDGEPTPDEAYPLGRTEQFEYSKGRHPASSVYDFPEAS